MKHIHFDVDRDGFYGAYWACDSDCALIAMLGDDPEDSLARLSVKWVLRQGVNVMTMSPGKKDYGHHNYPLERIERAIFTDLGHGGLAGEHPGQFFQEVQSAHRRDCAKEEAQ